MIRALNCLSVRRIAYQRKKLDIQKLSELLTKHDPKSACSALRLVAHPNRYARLILVDAVDGESRRFVTALTDILKVDHSNIKVQLADPEVGHLVPVLSCLRSRLSTFHRCRN